MVKFEKTQHIADGSFPTEMENKEDNNPKIDSNSDEDDLSALKVNRKKYSTSPLGFKYWNTIERKINER